MQNSVEPKFASPLTVVAHDAGAANLIIGWLLEQRGLEIRTCLGGPAVNLWANAFGYPKIIPISEALDNAAVLLSGTSYASNIEHESRGLAKEKGVFSIGVIDHWVNYPNRFLREGSQILPDEIWVADCDAFELAKKCFPKNQIRLQPNFYLSNLVAQVQMIAKETPHVTKRRILYALEPIRQTWPPGDSPGEFQALDFFLKKGSQLDFDRTTEIRLRPHPSDPIGKYDGWLALQDKWDIRIDPCANLAQSIAWSDTVAGCETYAMVVGLAAGRRVISSLPPNAPRCRLPMKGITHLRDFPSL